MNNLIISQDDLKFRLPFGMMISGPSSSGKTTFLMKFLKFYEDLIHPVPQEILYCYGEYHNFIPQLEKFGVNVYAGLPTDEIIKNCKKPLLLILDDLMLYANEKYLADLFTKKSHHQNIGVIFIPQNLFEKSIKIARNNSQYLILMRAPNAALQIRNIGSQLFPRDLNFFLDSYNYATKQPYGYILIDLHAASPPILKLRTNIFPDDLEKTVFISKNA